MAYVDFLMKLHTSTKRDYLQRVNEHDKGECSEVAIQYGKDYWDGDRTTGYGGYRYDGRWRVVADALAKHYGLRSGDRVLDVGCGKGFLLHDLTESVPGIEIVGIDISEYALENAKEEVRPFLQRSSASKLSFPDDSFDLVISITTLHNLYCYDLHSALQEIERVNRGKSYLCVESYRNEDEKANLLYWQLTCEMFCTPEEWDWWFNLAGYTGDHSFIFFE